MFHRTKPPTPKPIERERVVEAEQAVDDATRSYLSAVVSAAEATQVQHRVRQVRITNGLGPAFAAIYEGRR